MNVRGVLWVLVALMAVSRVVQGLEPCTTTPMQCAKELVAKMTTEEKLSLMHGSCGGYVGNVCPIPRLGIPQLKLNDGPQGFRGQSGTSTSWPGSLTVASAWDPELMMEWGVAMGDEFYRKGSNVQLGPGVCVARVPRNGRNFEYLSGEDPFLGYTLVQPVVKGIQSNGVVACTKHYVNNNQETQRTSISEVVDERTQFEIYYPPFEGAVQADLGSIMCSYNKINGTWSCENPETLQRDLKERLGFKGWVMSDWGATHSTSIMAGLDQEMPGASWMGAKLTAAVAAGTVPMSKVDDSATRILWPLFAVGLDKHVNNNTKSNNVSNVEHTLLARKISSQSTILLKNEGGVLPLNTGIKKFAVIGRQAESPIVHGGGSGQVFPAWVAAPLTSLRNKLGIPIPPRPPANCSDGHFEKGIDFFNQDGQTSGHADSVQECCNMCANRAGAPCYAFSFEVSAKTCWMKADDKGRKANPDVISGICASKPPQPPVNCTAGGTCLYYDDGTDTDRAAKLAATVDVPIVFVGTSSSEGGDRSSLSVGEDPMVEAVVAANPKTVVVIVTPGAVLTPWADKAAAVVTPMMPGQEYGNAITDVLFGVVPPSGRLAVTFPNVENEVNFTKNNWPGVNGVATYSEKLNVGYRWYATHKVKPAFAFGHGLTYTTFQYSALKASTTTVTFTLTNTGHATGSEVTQVYLQFPDSAGEPPMQLKGFYKVKDLAPGASKQVTIPLSDRSFSIWDVTTHAWTVVKGNFQVMVGASSQDIKLTATVTQ